MQRTRSRERPAGDFDYEAAGSGYAMRRRPDPRIAALVHDAIGDAQTVINVGAGAGSYEPVDRYVVAVEPSAVMRAQRPAHLTPALDASAEALPFDDDAFAAAMATVTVHQWTDCDAGLREMRRVSRGPVVVMTFDATALLDYWLNDYFPDVIATERRRFPDIDHIVRVLGGDVEIVHVPIPADCTDGFGEAYYDTTRGIPRPRRPCRPIGMATDRPRLRRPRPGTPARRPRHRALGRQVRPPPLPGTARRSRTPRDRPLNSRTAQTDIRER